VHFLASVTTHPRYHQFIVKKMRHRADFFKSFTMKNRFFVAGAALYTLGSFVPVCLKLMAALGSTSKNILNPKMLLAMFMAAIGGAAIMGVFSAQFFFGHPKQDRYDGYAVRSTPELDRRFLTSIDIFSFYNASGQRESPTQAHARGFAMREAVFTMLKEREQLHANLVSHIAVAQHRVLPKTMHSEENGYAYQRSYRMKAKIALFPLRLRVKHAADWASRSTNYPAIIDFFHGSIGSQIKLLKQKNTLQERMEMHIDPQRAEQRKLMDMLSGSRKETTQRIEKLQEVLNTLGTNGTWEDREATMKAVLESQGVQEVKFTPDSPVEHFLATFLVKTMPAETAADRGTLLEVERDAGEIRRSFIWK